MLTKTWNPEAENFDVTFDLPEGLDIDQASVCGEFNDWDPRIDPMEQTDDGRWTATVPLTPGQSYRFRYHLGDDEWENDWSADDYVGNEYGGADSVVTVPDVPTPPPPAKRKSAAPKAATKKAAPKKAAPKKAAQEGHQEEGGTEEGRQEGGEEAPAGVARWPSSQLPRLRVSAWGPGVEGRAGVDQVFAPNESPGVVRRSPSWPSGQVGNPSAGAVGRSSTA